ncbi:MAG: hypothetical protein FJ098_03470 [Deltaproteobacteria bacterium]|nr:hypothetical protein [Deltaproteobacteria bacterium]
MGRDGKNLVRWLWERCTPEEGGVPSWGALVKTARRHGISLATVLLAFQGAGLPGCDTGGGGGGGQDTVEPPQDTIHDTARPEDVLYPILADLFRPPEVYPVMPMDVQAPDRLVDDSAQDSVEDAPPMPILPLDTVGDTPPMPILPLDTVGDTPPMPILPLDAWADTPPPDAQPLPCTSDADCPEGMECDLPQCPPGMYCILPPVPPEGACVPVVATECLEDKDCPEGQICEGAITCPPGAMCILPASPGTCVDAPMECLDDTDCPPGQECVGASVCPPGMYCILADKPGTCEEPSPPQKPSASADSGSWRGLAEAALRGFGRTPPDDEPHAA